MARKPRKQADVRAKYGLEQGGPPRPGRPRKNGDWNGLDFTEMLTAVCKLFCNGSTAADIKRQMKERYNVDMSREEPYQVLSWAASNRWIRFTPPHEHALREKIRAHSGWLRDVDVVHTAVYDDVAYRGALMLLEMVKEHHRPPLPKDEVHIGFAGGHAMRKVARCFSQLLCYPNDDMPAKLVFHAMAAGFNVFDPTTDPNAFFTYFVGDPAIAVETGLVGLHAPGVVTSRQFGRLRATAGIKESYECADEVDIVVTSGSLWEHSMLRQYFENSEKSLRVLEEAGCLGDMLWQPLGPDGPIAVKTDIRAMTLLELEDLPGLIERGKHVLLILGPCGLCNAPKTPILEAVLRAQPHLITHVVVDSRAAREVVPRS